jgi:hypothetical protein
MTYEKFRKILSKEEYFSEFENISELNETIKDTIYRRYLVKCEVFKRDNFTCQNELCQTPEVGITLHHVKWQKNGGKDVARNCLTLCATCHRGYHKGKREIKVFNRAELPTHFKGHTLKFEKEKEINWKEIKVKMKELRKSIKHFHGIELDGKTLTLLMRFLFIPYEEWED